MPAALRSRSAPLPAPSLAVFERAPRPGPRGQRAEPAPANRGAEAGGGGAGGGGGGGGGGPGRAHRRAGRCPGRCPGRAGRPLRNPRRGETPRTPRLQPRDRQRLQAPVTVAGAGRRGPYRPRRARPRPPGEKRFSQPRLPHQAPTEDRGVSAPWDALCSLLLQDGPVSPHPSAHGCAGAAAGAWAVPLAPRAAACMGGKE